MLEDADPSSPLLKLGVLPKFLNKEDETKLNSFIISHLSWGAHSVSCSPIIIKSELPVLEPINQSIEPSSSQLLTKCILSGSVE